jgi:hypothetical protein
MDITAERLADLRALLDAATPGPWEAVDLRHQKNGQIRILPLRGGWIIANVLAKGDNADADTEMIVAAVNALPEMLALAGTCGCYDGNPDNYEGQRADCPVHGSVRAYAEASAEVERLRGELAKAHEAVSNLEHALNVVQLREIRQGQLEQRVRELHKEFDGRCVSCVEYCDCLERGRKSLEDCTHGNVDWPCDTIRALAAAPSAVETPAPDQTRDETSEGGLETLLEQSLDLVDYERQAEAPKYKREVIAALQRRFMRSDRPASAAVLAASPERILTAPPPAQDTDGMPDQPHEEAGDA